MSYEIIGETIKSATSIKIGDIFKTSSIVNGQTVYSYPYRYKEAVTNVKYPHFFITQVQLTQTPRGIGNGRIQLDYLVNVRYRIASDLATVTNIQQQLDAVGLKLCTELTELDLDLPTKTKNRYYEKDDGVLQFFFNITVFAMPSTEEKEKMKEFNLTEEVY